MDKQKIIDAIDDNLIERGKDNMTLGYANQILLLRGLINDNIVLKTMLQKGQIPHAYQTKQIPHQWRIPLSKGGKKRKKKIESVQDLICFEDQLVEERGMQKTKEIQYPFNGLDYMPSSYKYASFIDGRNDGCFMQTLNFGCVVIAIIICFFFILASIGTLFS